MMNPFIPIGCVVISRAGPNPLLKNLASAAEMISTRKEQQYA